MSGESDGQEFLAILLMGDGWWEGIVPFFSFYNVDNAIGVCKKLAKPKKKERKFSKKHPLFILVPVCVEFYGDGLLALGVSQNSSSLWRLSRLFSAEKEALLTMAFREYVAAFWHSTHRKMWPDSQGLSAEARNAILLCLIVEILSNFRLSTVVGGNATIPEE